MTNWGSVCSHNGKFFAKVEAQVDGIRFYVTGPRRDDEHQAGQDLKYIRAVTGTRPFEGATSICILVPRNMHLS